MPIAWKPFAARAAAEAQSQAGQQQRGGLGHGVRALGAHDIQKHHIALGDLTAGYPGGDPAHGAYRRHLPKHPGQRNVAVGRGLNQRSRRLTCLHQQPDAVGDGLQGGLIRALGRQSRHQPGFRFLPDRGAR